MGTSESYDKYIDEANKIKAFETQAVKKRVRLLEILLASIESRPKMSETETKQGTAQE
jgi:hypothetical protein